MPQAVTTAAMYFNEDPSDQLALTSQDLIGGMALGLRPLILSRPKLLHPCSRHSFYSVEKMKGQVNE